MIVLKHKNTHIAALEAANFYSDAARINASQTYIRKLRSKDTLPLEPGYEYLLEKAHRDHVQLIPELPPYPNRQYAGAELTSVYIGECEFWSPQTQCQGIFASDGFFRDLTIHNNKMHLGSQHKISINGLHSGWIGGNVDPWGKLLPVLLQPLRLLGAIWVIGFKRAEDEYHDLSCIIHDDTMDHVTDHRRSITRPGATYLTDFDLQGFRAAEKDVVADSANALCAQLKPIALEFGRRVYEK